MAVMDHGGFNMEKGKWEGNLYESWSDSGRAGMKGSLYAPVRSHSHSKVHSARSNSTAKVKAPPTIVQLSVGFWS